MLKRTSRPVRILPRNSLGGVRIEYNRKTETWAISIEKFSDDLKNRIRSNLAALCYGYKNVKRNSSIYSYENTVKEFVARYSSKSEDTQKGMIGELLSHILIKECVSRLRPASPFFNMEETSIRKGYDLILIDIENKVLWITEVKAGEVNGKKSDAANAALLHTAKRDLKERLNANSPTLWHNAVFAATVAMKEGNVKEQVLNILDDILKDTIGNSATSQERNVILVSVLYNDLKDGITLDSVIAFTEKLIADNLFNRSFVFSIQKNTYSRIEQFLIREASK